MRGVFCFAKGRDKKRFLFRGLKAKRRGQRHEQLSNSSILGQKQYLNKKHR